MPPLKVARLGDRFDLDDDLFHNAAPLKEKLFYPFQKIVSVLPGLIMESYQNVTIYGVIYFSTSFEP